MKVSEFMDSLQAAYSKNLSYDALEAYLRILPDEIPDSVMDAVLHECRTLPRPADIIARCPEKTSRPSTNYNPAHSWTPSNCPNCKGEGRCTVIRHVTFTNEGSEVSKLIADYPYSSIESVAHYLQNNERRYFKKCHCAEGNMARNDFNQS